MASYNVGGFVGPLIGLMVSAIILGALLSIFAGITMPEGYAYSDVLEQVFEIIPLVAGVGLLMFGVYYFISRR